MREKDIINDVETLECTSAVVSASGIFSPVFVMGVYGHVMDRIQEAEPKDTQAFAIESSSTYQIIIVSDNPPQSNLEQGLQIGGVSSLMLLAGVLLTMVLKPDFFEDITDRYVQFIDNKIDPVVHAAVNGTVDLVKKPFQRKTPKPE